MSIADIVRRRHPYIERLLTLDSAWADQRRRMRSYIAYTPRSGDRREYIAESGVYIWKFTTAAQRNVYVFPMEWPILPSPHSGG